MSESKFMIKEEPESFITEAYRKVAANIEFANIDKNIKTIMITSSIQGEGKTTTVCNTASVMTDLNKRVLLLDLDLRRPFVHKFFKLSNVIGLTDLLLRKDDYNNYIHSVYHKLDIITTGMLPPNPTEILNSKSIRELLKVLSLNYDYIFLDTPPIIMVSDPIIIATYVDAVILTVASYQTDIEAANKAISSLKQVNANLIGTVLNKAPMAKKKYYYSYGAVSEK